MKLRILIAILSVAVGFQSLQAIRCELECAGLLQTPSSIPVSISPHQMRSSAVVIPSMPDDCCGVAQVAMNAEIRLAYVVSPAVWVAMPDSSMAAMPGSAARGPVIRSGSLRTILAASGGGIIPLRV